MNRILFLILIISILISNISFSQNKLIKDRNFEEDIGNGIWIHINTFNNSSNQEIIDLCKFFLKKNIKNVFILAKDINGELLYKKYEKTLLNIIDIFKKFQIKIHYYIPIGYDPKFLKENPQEVSFCAPDKSNYNVYPDKEMKVPNLNSKKYLNYIKTVVKELIYYYNAEGIQLDYIRYPNVNYGYDENVKNIFISRGGNWDKILEIFRKNVDIFSLYDNKDKDVVLLGDVRSEIVTNFANEIKGFISSISKDIIFSVTLIQSGSSFLSYKEGGKDSFPYGFLHFGQNYRKLSEISDFVSPLAYHKNYDKNLEWVREIIINTKKKVVSKILCGIQGNDTHENIEKLINICKEEKVNFSLFRLGTFLPVQINLKNIDSLKYEINFSVLDKFYEYTKIYNFEIKIKELNLSEKINIKEKFVINTEKNLISIYLIGIPLLTDTVKLTLFNTIKFKIGANIYYLDGVKKTMDAMPFLFNGRTMIPVRVIAETLGYTVLWKDGEVVLNKKNLTINLFINKNKLKINGIEYFIDSFPIIKEGRTYLPIRYLSEVLNLIVSWNEKENEVLIEGYIDDEQEVIILYKNNLNNNIIRDLVFNKSNKIIFKNIDISSLIKLDREFTLRGIKIYLYNTDDLILNKDKLFSFDGIFIEEENYYYILKDSKKYNIFDTKEFLPKEALLNFANFRFKEKSNYYILVYEKFFIDLFKPYIEKDTNFSGFILKENS
ncbi:MAG: copper amine oxidase N-terminal domain-containing protein [Caldisericia bacterium]|nr:copper amine oxidase N-terminal domain-containing protein [Caldisericia bacterium]